MKRWILTALILSVALNLGFGLAWLGHQRTRASDFDPDARRGRPEQGKGHALHGPDRGQWAQRRAHRLHRELGLDPQRRDRLHRSLTPLAPEITDTRRELLDARRGFAQALHVEAPDHNQVMLLSKEVSLLQARLDSLVAEALLREAEILDLDERQRSGPWSLHPGERPSREEKKR